MPDKKIRLISVDNQRLDELVYYGINNLSVHEIGYKLQRQPWFKPGHTYVMRDANANLYRYNNGICERFSNPLQIRQIA